MCVRETERERDSGLRTSMTLGGKGGVCLSVCLSVSPPHTCRPAGEEWLGFDWVESLVSDQGIWT